MDTAVKIPLWERINWRMIVFFAVIGLAIGYPVYIGIADYVTGGVHMQGSYLAVNLKATGNFEFNEHDGTVNDVPPKYRELDGKDVLFEGEIYAPNEAGDEIHAFQLVYSIAKCCFNGPPKVQERVFCTVPNNGTVKRPDGFARVRGKLHVEVKREGPAIVSLYTLDVKSVEPL
jgi:hypothetical protein